MSKARPLEDKVVVGCGKDAPLPSSSVSIHPGNERVGGSVGTSNDRTAFSTPTNRILANRGARPAIGNAAADTSPTSKAPTHYIAGNRIRVPTNGRPGRSMSAAAVPDRLPQRPLPCRKPSSGAAGRAGVDDLVQLLGTMDVAASSLAAARLAQLRGMRQPQQHTEMSGCRPQVAKGPELRLSVPPPVARKPSASSAIPVNPPQDLKSNRTSLPPPPKKPGNRQNKILASAMLTPPELRKSIR
ncbi:hypothetical protein H4S07_003547 [Coemansia furcata]|uniref:Uncharacterized protein n=1 Tax=Coemansia furcata TaxID=417177 RepID=A0ACC1LHC7_9FUNG|nr:hypothetical protein H4S07_003547 [Coemansia furcata]